MNINIKYLPIKAHYFFYWGGVASIWSFIAVFGKQMGISEVGVGLIFTVAPIAGLLAKPVFGAIADRFKKKKMLFLFFLLLNLMAYLCVAFLPQNPPVRPVLLHCGVGLSSIRQCGRINPYCADRVIGEFREPGSERALNQSIHPLSFERCSGHCEIHSVIEGVNFCHSLFPEGAQPFLCRWMLNRTSPFMESGNGVRVHPHVIQFQALLHMEDALMVESGREDDSTTCLELPIRKILFDKDNGTELEDMLYNNSTTVPSLSCESVAQVPQCFINCPENRKLNRALEAIQEEEELLDAMNFWMYGSLVVIAWIAMSVVESLADAMCFQTLGDEGDKYGKQRLWGTLGWGIFQLVAGYLIDTSSQGKLLKDYTSSFYLTAFLLTIDLVVAYKWGVREVEKTKSLRRDLCSVLSNLRIVVFIVACVIIGMCTGLLWNFLFWYVEHLSEIQRLQTTCESHQWIKLLQGLIGAMQCVGELPFFFISGWLIQRIGHVHCITLVLGAFGVRFILYSFITNPWWILPIELLQGLTYGVFYSTMVSYANRISPAGTSATVIGVVQSAFLGIGVASGSLVGGLIFNKYNGETAFRTFGVGCLIFCGIHALVMCILNKKSGYGFPADRTEPEGQEMFKISSSTGDMDADSGGI